MKAAFFTLGCKVNQYETQNMLETLESAGYEIVSCDEEADVYIVNSCTVTASGDQKTRQTVRHFKRLHPDSVVVLTGCMPQAYPEQAKTLTQADIVLGNKSNDKLLDTLDEYFLSGKRIFSVSKHETGDKFKPVLISDFNERTRAFVKIEDGCDRYCSYCIIPTARGHVRSRKLDDLKKELLTLAEAGFKEIVLVGINLSAYGRDTGEKFTQAVSLACSVDGIERVRLGSLEPDHITQEVINELSKCEKLCPQFHISLQSGCNETLKRMNRHYSAEEYAELCTRLRAAFPNASITTDVMVGFSGESEDEFAASLEFVKKTGFAKVHIFPYSVRRGTRAAMLTEQVSNAEKKRRCKILQDAVDTMRRDFLQTQVGQVFPVLFETKHEDSWYEGYTPNYTPVHVKSDVSLSGQLHNVLIESATQDYCIGLIEK